VTDERDELWSRLDELLQAALELAPDERPAFLDRECGDDTELRRRLDHLLALAESGDSWLQPGGGVPESETITRHVGAHALETVGPYRLRHRIGHGGMGEVWLADQEHPVRRRVALKLIREGMSSREVVARFESERQALALMDHPNIAKVLDAGVTEDGRPFFAMEYVPGVPITEHCDRDRLGLRERLELFLPVCAAVQHAHQKAIIHRDLKPTNVLVATVDGQAVPKVIDFGIAKALTTPLTDKTLHTHWGQIVGTPAYMSPEQAEIGGVDVDTTTDVWSLGVILYALLVGRLPFGTAAESGSGVEELLRVIREVDPPVPSAAVARDPAAFAKAAEHRRTDARTLARALRGELDWIVMKALEKNRTRRYQTALRLAEDIRHHLDDEPVEAGPPSTAYRLGKLFRRHRVAITVAGALTFGVIGAAVGLTYALVESNRQRAAIAEALAEAETVTDFLSNMLGSVSPQEQGRDVSVREVLDEAGRTIEKRFGEHPLVEARLRHAMGVAYREIGDLEPAGEHLRFAWDTRRSILGEEAPRTLQTLQELGQLRSMGGDFPGAESTFTRVAEARTRVLGPTDRETLAAIKDLGAVFLLEERNAAAESVMTPALEVAHSELEPDDPLVAALEVNLGTALRELGRLEEAEPLLRSVYEREKVTYADRPALLVDSMASLGQLYRAMGRYEDAEPLYAGAVEIGIQELGKDHPITFRYRNNLALLYSDMGRFDEAKGIFEELVEARLRESGADNPGTLVSQINLALVDFRRGDFEASARRMEAVEPTASRVFGEDHGTTLVVRSILGASCTGLGQARRAEPILAEVLAEREATLPADHPRVSGAHLDYGEALVALGRLEEARAHLETARDGIAAYYGPRNPYQERLERALAATAAFAAAEGTP